MAPTRAVNCGKKSCYEGGDTKSKNSEVENIENN